MHYLKLSSAFGPAFDLLKRNFRTWFLAGVIGKIIPMLFISLLSWQLANFAEPFDGDFTNPSWYTSLALINWALNFAYTESQLEHIFFGKLYLSLVRQPELVKQHFWQAILYNLTDGFWRRLRYSLAFVLQSLGLFLLIINVFLAPLTIPFFDKVGIQFLGAIIFILPFIFFFLFGIGLLIYRVAVAPGAFLIPFMIQDTCSRDNLSKPLPYRECSRRAEIIIRGRRVSFMGFLYLQGFLPAVSLFPLGYIVTGFKGDLAFLLVIQLLAVLMETALWTIPTIIKTVWADRLMEFDPEIVDFGD